MKTTLNDTLKAQLMSVDPDRCRAAMFAEEGPRAALLTLYAFHYELAKIPELISEPMMGAIRYQWWREAIEEMYSGGPVRRHEVSTPLAEVTKDYDIPRFYLDQLIDGRERDIDGNAFETVDAAREYAASTSGLLARIAAHICAHDKAYIAADLGAAWGMAGLVRGWGFYKDGLLKGMDVDALRLAASDDYTAAAKAAGKLPPIFYPAIGYAALIPGFLKRHGSQPPKLYSPLAKQSRLLITALTGMLPA